MFGKGLVKGLGITLKHFFEKKITQQYPEERPDLPDRFKGSFDLDISKCIACGLCARACPNNVIEIETVKGEDKKKKVTGYKMMTERCLYCGFCVEQCPTKALKWTKDFENTKFFREDVNLDLFDGYEPPPEDNEPKKADAEAKDSAKAS